EEQLGPFRTWQICRHAPEDECSCRKPAAGLIQQAAAELEAPTSACVAIGDTGADVEAALAAGAKAILVPTRRTLPQEIEHASQHASVEPTVRKAVRRILDGGLCAAERSWCGRTTSAMCCSPDQRCARWPRKRSRW